MAQFIDIAPFAPESAMSNPTRSLAGIINMQTAVADGSTYTDADNNPAWARWLYVGTTGNVTIIKIDGTTQNLTNIAAGVFHPIIHIGIAASGTTAGGLVWGN